VVLDAEQRKEAGGEPAGKFPNDVPPDDALLTKSITPAVQAASAAPCAIWR